MTIGREEADITIEDQEISRHHAEVRPAGGGLEIEDMGSTNGTFVNETRVSSATPLQPGDTLRVGQVELQMESSPASGGTMVAGGTAISQSPPPASESPADESETQGWQPAPESPADVETQAWEPAPSGPSASEPAAGHTPPPAAYTPPPAAYTPPPAQQPYTPPQSPPTYSAPPSYGSGPPGPGYGGGPASSKPGSNKLPLIIGAVVALLAIVAIVLFVFPGVLKPSDEDKIRDVVATFGEEFGNGDALCELFTDRFLEEQFGETGDAATEACAEQVDSQDQDAIDITITSVDVQGERATVEADVDTGETTEPGTMELENVDGEWLVDAVE